MSSFVNKSKISNRLQRFLKTWKVFSSNWIGMTGLLILLTLVLLAIFGTNMTPYEPHQRTSSIYSEPNSDHILGTNRLGEDVFTILLSSLRISLLVGIMAGSLTVILGTTIGVTSAYLGGRADRFIMRIADIVLVMPALPLMLVLSSIQSVVFESSMHWSIIAIVYVVVFWPVSARLIRGQALSLKERTFVTSAKAAGANNRYIIFNHLLPNVFPLMVTMIITSMRQAILYEAFLAYLGLGDPWNWSLGLMLRVAQNQAALATGAWWLIFPPAIAIALTTLSFAFIGIAFDEIVNPKLRKR